MSAPSPIVFRSASAAAFVATALAGWHLAGDHSSASPAPGEESGTAKVAKRVERSVRHSGPPAHVRAELDAIRDAGSTGNRMRATIDLATRLPVADLAEWLEKHWFDTGDGFDLTLFRKIAMQRWREEDPEGLMAWNMKNSPGNISQTMSSWVKTDPARALAFFQEHPNQSMEMRILAEVAKVDAALALSHLKEMIDRGMGSRSGSDLDERLFQEIAKRDPAALEAALDSLPPVWRIRAEGAAVGARLKADFAGELRELRDRPDGWKVFQAAMGSTEGVKDKLFNELANLPSSWKSGLAAETHRYVDQESAAKWLDVDLEGMGFSQSQTRNIHFMALQYHSFQKPVEALEKLADFGLEEEQKRNLISNIFGNSGRDPEMAEKLMAALDNDVDRAVAQKSLDGMQLSSNETKVENPTEWLEKVGTLDPNQSFRFMHQLDQWDKEKIAVLADEFRVMPDEKKLPVAKLLATGFYTEEGDQGLRGEAIRFLVGQPQTPQEEGVLQQESFNPSQIASRYAVMLATKDPDSATQWVRSLPNGEAKQWAQKNLAANWAKYDPDAMDQWVKSLPSADRTEVEAFLKK